MVQPNERELNLNMNQIGERSQVRPEQNLIENSVNFI